MRKAVSIFILKNDMIVVGVVTNPTFSDSFASQTHLTNAAFIRNTASTTIGGMSFNGPATLQSLDRCGNVVINEDNISMTIECNVDNWREALKIEESE